MSLTPPELYNSIHNSSEHLNSQDEMLRCKLDENKENFINKGNAITRPLRYIIWMIRKNGTKEERAEREATRKLRDAVLVVRESKNLTDKRVQNLWEAARERRQTDTSGNQKGVLGAERVAKIAYSNDEWRIRREFEKLSWLKERIPATKWQRGSSTSYPNVEELLTSQKKFFNDPLQETSSFIVDGGINIDIASTAIQDLHRTDITINDASVNTTDCTTPETRQELVVNGLFKETGNSAATQNLVQLMCQWWGPVVSNFLQGEQGTANVVPQRIPFDTRCTININKKSNTFSVVHEGFFTTNFTGVSPLYRGCLKTKMEISGTLDALTKGAFDEFRILLACTQEEHATEAERLNVKKNMSPTAHGARDIEANARCQYGIIVDRVKGTGAYPK